MIKFAEQINTLIYDADGYQVQPLALSEQLPLAFRVIFNLLRNDKLNTNHAVFNSMLKYFYYGLKTPVNSNLIIDTHTELIRGAYIFGNYATELSWAMSGVLDSVWEAFNKYELSNRNEKVKCLFMYFYLGVFSNAEIYR